MTICAGRRAGMWINMKYSISEIQKIESDMLFHIMEISKEHGFDVFASAGTVLGAVRHHGPIPWDSDADIYIPFPDFVSFCTALDQHLPNKYTVNSYESNGRQEILYGKVGVRGLSDTVLHVDIFPLLGLPDNPKKHNKFMSKAVRLKWIHYYKTHKLSRDNLLGRICCKCIPLSSMYIRKLFKNYVSRYDYYKSEYVFNANPGKASPKKFSKAVFGKGTWIQYEDFKIRVPERYDDYLRIAYGDYMKLPPIEERNKQNQLYFISEVE